MSVFDPIHSRNNYGKRLISILEINSRTSRASASLSESFSLYFCRKKDDQEGTCKLNLQKFKWFSENCICDALRDLGSVTIWRLHDRSNVCECMLTLFSTFMSFLSVCMSQHGIQTVLSNDKRLNAIQAGKHTSNLMTFECCFLIS